MRKKYILLFPLTYNDQSRVPRKILNDFLEELYVLGGGHHVAGRGRGTYRMQSGEKQVDLNLEIWIALEEGHVQELRVIISKYCGLLEQESMYFEDTGAIVDFIGPDAGGTHE